MENLLTILTQQLENCQIIVGSIKNISLTAQNIILQDIPETDKKTQIKSLMASADIYMTSLNSQDVLVQQTIDKILELVNE